LVSEQIQKQFDFLEQSSAASAGDYKFALKYEVLDGGNGTNYQVLETWELDGCQISQCDWGDMNYGSNEAAMIAVTVRFDNAILVPLSVPNADTAGFGQTHQQGGSRTTA
jgi:hypothetical protein